MPLFGASRAKRALERADDCGGIAVGQVAITGLTVGPHLEQVGSLQWSVNCGSLLWTPDAARVASANLTAFGAWLAERGQRFDTYSAICGSTDEICVQP